MANKYLKILYTKALLLIIVACGCVSGGYFINHQKTTFYVNKKTTLTLELSVNIGNAEKAFNCASVSYTVNKKDQKSIAMTKIFSSDSSVIFLAEVPPIKDAGSAIDYYFCYGCDEEKKVFPEDRAIHEIVVKQDASE